MAGYALGFDDGGDIQEDDRSEQASPAIPEDESAGLDTSRHPGSGYWQNNFDEAQRGVGNVGAAAKRIIGYLMGAGGASPQVADQVVQQVKSNDPHMSDDDANLLAVHEAGQKGGPAAAWAMLQYNRSAYNAKQTFAQAALNGVDGKAGNIAAAAQAATQAGSHVLDGSQAVFTATSPDNITATVRSPDGRSQQYQLNGQQFAQYLDTGKAGQWDRVMASGGVGGTLQKLAQQHQQQQQQQQSDDDDESPAAPPVTRAKQFGQTPSTVDLAPEQGPGLRGYKPLDYDAMEDPNSSSLARANQLFPSMSAQDHAGRRQYRINEEQREETAKNALEKAKAEGGAKVEVAKTAAGAKEKAADIYAGGRKNAAEVAAGAKVKAAETTVAGRLKEAEAKAQTLQQQLLMRARQMEMNHQDAAMRERGRNLRNLVGNVNMSTTEGGTDAAAGALKKLQQIDSQFGSAAQAPQQPGQAAPQKPAATTSSSVPPVSQRVTGTVYTTPKGQFRWMGNGWQPL